MKMNELEYENEQHNIIDNLSERECKEQLKLYYDSFGRTNELYNKCDGCIYKGEFVCKRYDCIRSQPTLDMLDDNKKYIKDNDKKVVSTIHLNSFSECEEVDKELEQLLISGEGVV